MNKTLSIKGSVSLNTALAVDNTGVNKVDETPRGIGLNTALAVDNTGLGKIKQTPEIESQYRSRSR